MFICSLDCKLVYILVVQKDDQPTNITCYIDIDITEFDGEVRNICVKITMLKRRVSSFGRLRHI
jgi:hypothetical protein